MGNFGSVDEALDFAIGEEEAACAFYSELAKKAKQAGMKELLLQFAGEENGHREKLLSIKQGKKMMDAEQQVTDLKIGDYLVEAEPDSDLSYQDALVIAMKKEKSAFRMYTNMAAASTDPTMRNIFLGLAQEEANHKLRFELEYDNEVMTDN